MGRRGWEEEEQEEQEEEEEDEGALRMIWDTASGTVVVDVDV